MGRIQTGRQRPIGNECCVTSLGRVIEDGVETGVQYLANVEVQGVASVARDWRLIATHARAIARQVQLEGWDNSPRLLYPKNWGLHRSHRAVDLHCYMHVSFVRAVSESVDDDDALLQATARRLQIAWSKTEAACMAPAASEVFGCSHGHGYPIRPVDVFLPEQPRDFLLYCNKAETNWLAYWVVQQSQESEKWLPIPYSVLHTRTGREDVILREMLEKHWLVDEPHNDRYAISTDFVDYVWRVSLNIPQAEIA